MASGLQSLTHFNRSLPQPRITQMVTDKLQGSAWASQAAMDFQIPLQASLHGILKLIAHFAPHTALHLPLHQNEK